MKRSRVKIREQLLFVHNAAIVRVLIDERTMREPTVEYTSEYKDNGRDRGELNSLGVNSNFVAV